MWRIIGYAGPFAIPLGILTLLLSALIVAALAQAWRLPNGRTGAPGKGGAAILFWGFVAAILGFLGQCAALYRMMTTVVDADAISPDIVAEGFAASFVTTVWGVGLLLVAGLTYVLLRGVTRSRGPVILVVLLSVVGMQGCGRDSEPAPDDITQGVWIGDGGQERFLFDLRGTSPDSLTGFVHVMGDGKMTSQLAITSASYQPPDLVMSIQSTNATYRGRVDPPRGRVHGSLSFGDQAGPDMELLWADPEHLQGFRALAQEGPYRYRQPTEANDGWVVATPEEVDLDRGRVELMVDAVANEEAGLLHSLVVVRRGRLVAEEYFHGYTADDLHRLASTTKSIASLLVGAAVDRGLISGPDQPILSFFPAVSPAGHSWEGETLGDVLTMSMGLDWTVEEAQSVHGTGEAFFRRVLQRDVVEDPGTKWDYVSANVNLLAGVIFNATGQHAEVFAHDVLFSPLGITTYDWEYGKEGGYNLMDGSLHLRPRDLAKIGAMVAQGGRWNGRQVISEQWIEESTELRFRTEEPLDGYGYLWWLGELPCEHGNEPMIVANGWGSQFIVIFPRLDMVVVSTGGNDDNGLHTALGAVLARTLLSGM